MDDFLANKIIDDFLTGTLTATEAWTNLRECRDCITDEQYDEIVTLIVENLVESELVESDELDNNKLEEILDQTLIEDLHLDFDSDEDEWLLGNDVY